MEKFLKRNPRTSFVAELDGKIVGVIMSGHDGRRGYIYHTFVDKEFRRTGIGTQLVNAALEALKNEGIRKVDLVVSYWNEDGKEFLNHMGFIARPELTYHEKSLVDPAWIDGIIHMI